MQIFIFLRNASLYKEFFLAHVNVSSKKYHCIIIQHCFPCYALIINTFAVVIHCHIPLVMYHQCITILK